jgi:hypothetical protein
MAHVFLLVFLCVEFPYLQRFRFEIEEAEEIMFSYHYKFSHNFQSIQEPTISYTQLLCVENWDEQ